MDEENFQQLILGAGEKPKNIILKIFSTFYSLATENSPPSKTSELLEFLEIMEKCTMDLGNKYDTAYWKNDSSDDDKYNFTYYVYEDGKGKYYYQVFYQSSFQKPFANIDPNYLFMMKCLLLVTIQLEPLLVPRKKKKDKSNKAGEIKIETTTLGKYWANLVLTKSILTPFLGKDLTNIILTSCRFDEFCLSELLKEQRT